MNERRLVMSEALSEVQERINAAAKDSGRDRNDITLVAVTKTFPADDVAILASLGLTQVAENRVDELQLKRSEYHEIARERQLDSFNRPTPVTWHMVGQVQSKKAGAVAREADIVHSVDREKLIASLDRGAERHEKVLDVLIQLKTGDASTRGGAEYEEIFDLAKSVDHSPSLRLRGVMAMAPKHGPAESAFARLQALSNELRKEYPQANWISAGMSDDLEIAIAHGATHVRVGRGLLGSRANLG